MNTAIAELFESLQICPVLVEIGSTGQAADTWTGIAPQSTYVGIGPESAGFKDASSSAFREFIPIGIAVADQPANHAKLHVAKDPVYSSLLEPNTKVLSEFFDLGMFKTDHDREVTCSALDDVLNNFKIRRIDWFKTNINGLDVRILNGLSGSFRRRLLAIDTCLDFIDMFQGQDATLAQHPELVNDGFWLSRLITCGGIKLRSDSLEELRKRSFPIDTAVVESHHRLSPGWAFATYFRTIESIRTGDFTRREYVVLWSFALLDGQFGFAADLAFAYENAFGRDAISDRMVTEAANRLQHLRPQISPLRQLLSTIIPDPFKRGLRRIVAGA